MNFVRREIGTIDPLRLRLLGARSGWLIETPDVLRVGFGGEAARITLEGHDNKSMAVFFKDVTLDGETGPRGTGVLAFGSLPFTMAMPGELFVPNVTISQFREGSTFVTTAQGTEPWESLIANQGLELQAQQPATSLQYQPMPEVYAHTVAKAVESLRRHELEKVVLARSISGTVGEQIDTGSIAQRLKLREPICTVYSLPVEGERRFTGASPELLVSRIGGEVECHPLAGTIALPADSNANDYESWLLGSAKNQREHQLMTDEIIANLKPLYSLNHDAAPSIVRLKSVAHLGTWIRGAFRNEGTAPNALDVLRSLHPTPAVGGIPRVEATELIHELEQRDRGHYAGPLGWIDESGDGDWWVGIRGVLTQGNAFEAWAGAGIVSESDPFSEREETKDKIASFLDAVLLENL